jgi:hypothetical protein
MVLSVCVASTLFGQTDDQSNKKQKKRARTAAQTAATPASNRTNQSSGKQKKQQQATNTYSKKQYSNAAANRNYNQNTANFRTSKKYRNQTNVVNNNNANWNKKNWNRNEWRHFKRTGNELSFSAARRWNWHQRHERDWWRRNNFRVVRYGGGYWYWNAGWWYPAYGYDPYYSHYVYDGPIFGYGQAFPGDVTSEVQQALAQQGFYYGPIDGILGPGTRMAIQRYQISRGLAVTATIDEQTLATLGLT